MPSISYSKYQTLRTCPRLFYWEHVRFMQRAREDGARAFGQLYHLGLEAWWRTAGEGDAPWIDTDVALVNALRAISEGSKHSETDSYEVAKAESMMIAYHAYYYDLQFERIGEGAEVWYEVPLRDPDGATVGNWKQIGRKDVLVRFEDRVRASVVEHKSTASDITPGTDYWTRLDVDGQISAYIDAGNASGHDVCEVMWDASRKPDLSPKRKTPDEERKMTKGRGCSTCGGSGGGKNGVKQGDGTLTINRSSKLWKKYVVPNGEPAGDVVEVTMPCPDCKEGWKDAPRWTADTNIEDEPVDDYRSRISEKIAENPSLYFRMQSITRDDDQINEARADLVAATVEIDGYWSRVRANAPSVEHPRARRLFPRNTSVCLNIYGRRCDFLDVCSGTIDDPANSPLYRIKQRPAQGATK